VADLRVQAADRQAAVRQAFAEASAVARAEREQAGAELRAAVATQQDGFRRAHAAMALETRAVGQSFVAGIVDAVTGLRQQTVQQVDEPARERAAAARAWLAGAAPRPVAAPPPSPVVASPKAAAKPVQKEKAPSRKEPPAAPVVETPAQQAAGESIKGD
jgi:hypothetical protein